MRAEAPAPAQGRRALRLPYSWRVWAGWLALLVVAVAIGTLIGYDASDGTYGAAASWLGTCLASVGYFELVNDRLRRDSGLNPKSGGLALAIAGLALGLVFVLFAGSISIVLAALAWRKLRRAGSPIVAGIPTAVAAFIVGCVDTGYAILVLGDVLP
jgi:hypothetical protein